MTDTTNLRALAEAATAAHGPGTRWSGAEHTMGMGPTCEAFVDDASPDRILALLDELDVLRAALTEIADWEGDLYAGDAFAMKIRAAAALGPRTGGDAMTDRRRPYTARIGSDAVVVRSDGSRIYFGDAIYHPENEAEARAYAALRAEPRVEGTANRWDRQELLDIFDRTADRPAIRAKIRDLVDPARSALAESKP